MVIDDHGMMHPDVFLRPTSWGQRVFFEQTLKKFISAWWQPISEFAKVDFSKDSETVQFYRKTLMIAHRENIDLQMILSPAHAYLNEVLATVGLWDTSEQWKRMLVRVNEEEATKAGRPAFPIWDFSGYNSITTEYVPARRDESAEMEAYWDPMHYKRAVGDMMLDVVFGRPAADRPENFGVRLTSENIESHLEQVRAARSHYRSTHGDEIARLLNFP